jgi:hypothetical protein
MNDLADREQKLRIFIESTLSSPSPLSDIYGERRRENKRYEMLEWIAGWERQFERLTEDLAGIISVVIACWHGLSSISMHTFHPDFHA